MKMLTAFLYVEDDLFGYVCFCIPPSVLRGREGQERHGSRTPLCFPGLWTWVRDIFCQLMDS